MDVLTQEFIGGISGKAALNFSSQHRWLYVYREPDPLSLAEILTGKNFSQLPLVTSRISAANAVSNTLASIYTLEKLFGVQPSLETICLRKVLQIGEIISSHAFHLYFQVVKDYLPEELNSRQSKERLKTGTALIALGQEIITIIGGRNGFPITPCLGGFTHKVSRSALTQLKNRIFRSLPLGLESLETISRLPLPETITRDVALVCLTNDKNYTLFPGKISSNVRTRTAIKNYQENFRLVPRPGSNCSYYRFHGKIPMCGPLARVSLQQRKLNAKTKQTINSLKIRVNPRNPFHNVLAEAIEIFSFLEEAVILLEKVISAREMGPNAPFRPKAGSAEGAVESSAGTIYQKITLKADGTLSGFSLLGPTDQNIAALEADLNRLLVQADIKNDEKYKLLEMLIRAYHPSFL